MDVSRSDQSSKKNSTVETSRPPLISTDKNNGATTRRSRTTEVSSRVRVRSPSPSSIRRFPSPSPNITTTNSASSVPKRAISAERKRPSTPALSTPVHDTSVDTKLAHRKVPSSTVNDTHVDTILTHRKVPSTPVYDTSVDTKLEHRKVADAKLPDAVWPSTVRSLNVSFQSDKLSQFDRKPAEITLTISRKPTPERKRVNDHLENSKPVDVLHARLSDQRRWPSSTTVKVFSSALTKSVDTIDSTGRASNALHIGMEVSSVTSMSFPDLGNKALKKAESDSVSLGSKTLKKPESDSMSLGSFDGSEGEELEQRSVDNISLRIPNMGSSSSCPASPNEKSLSPSSVSSDSPSRTKASNPASIRGISPSRTRASNPASIRGISPSRTRASNPASVRGISPSRTMALDPASSRGVTKRIVVDQLKNSKPVDGLHARLLDQCRWPSSTNLKVSSNSLTKSVDAIDETARAPNAFHMGVGVSSLRRMSFPDFGSIPLKNPESDSVSLGSFEGSEGQDFEGSYVDYGSLRIPKIGSSSSCPTSPNKTSSPSSVSSVSPYRTRASDRASSRGVRKRSATGQLENSKPIELHTHRSDQYRWPSSTEVKVQSMDAIEKTARVSNALHLGMGVSSHMRMSFPDFGSKPLDKSRSDSASLVSFDGSEGEDIVKCSIDDISHRIPKIASSSSCPTSPDKTSLSPSSVSSVSPSQTKASNPAFFRGIKPSLTRTSNPTSSIGVKTSVTDQIENSKLVEGFHSRLLEPRRWPSSTAVKISSSSLTKSMDAIDNAARDSNALHLGMRVRRMSFPDFWSKPLEKPTSDSASLVSFDGSEEEEFEGRAFDDNSLRIPNIGSSSSCPVSPDKASLSPSSVSSVSPSRSRSTNPASIRGIGPFHTRASNLASIRGISSSQIRVSNPASTRGLSPSRTRASNTASIRGVSPTPIRGLNAASSRGVSPTPTRGLNAASTRGVSPTPTRGSNRGVSPTPTRGSNAASARGVSPTPTWGSNAASARGVSPTLTWGSNAASARGVSPTPSRASNAASTRGVSPTPSRALNAASTRGVSPTQSRASNAASIRGVSPIPTRASNTASTRGVSPTPRRASDAASTRGVSPTPSMASNDASPRGVSSTPRALNPVSTRGVSPSRMRASNPPIRGVSPTPLRPSSPSRESSSSTSVLNFITDIRKGNKVASHVEDVHQLWLLNNRHLQWRYANARADKLLYNQKVAAQRKLYNTWRTTSELSDSVTEKRIDLEELRLKLKLYSVLHKQMTYLKEWDLVERNHTCLLSQAIEDLQTSTFNLPVTGGARADTESVKAAVSSAIDGMQRIGSSLCSILSRVEGVNSLASELAAVAAEERALLDECEALFCTTAAMQVEEYSLRTHLVQLKQAWKGGEQPTFGH